jgi:hypothetical protein
MVSSQGDYFFDAISTARQKSTSAFQRAILHPMDKKENNYYAETFSDDFSAGKGRTYRNGDDLSRENS